MNNYNLIKKTNVNNLNAVLYMYEHVFGNRVVFVKNNDLNLSFCVTFKTLPGNNKGIPHIVEHMMMTHSKKYQDSFNHVSRSSLYTYLNAITFHDKTMYPFATYDKSEFKKILDIYLDGVYNPVFNHDIFESEKRVVLNEMISMYENPYEAIKRKNYQMIFENQLGFDSAGLPDQIMNATLNEVSDFHNKNYINSNSFLYFYGDIDIVYYLNYLDCNFFTNKTNAITYNFNQGIFKNQYIDILKHEYKSAVFFISCYYDETNILLAQIATNYFNEIFRSDDIDVFFENDYYFPSITFITKTHFDNFETFLYDKFKKINIPLLNKCYEKVKMDYIECFHQYRPKGLIKSFEIVNNYINYRSFNLNKLKTYDKLEIDLIDNILRFFKCFLIDKAVLTGFTPSKNKNKIPSSKTISSHLKQNISSVTINKKLFDRQKLENTFYENLYFEIDQTDMFYLNLHFSIDHLNESEFYYVGILREQILWIMSDMQITHDIYNDKEFLTLSLKSFVKFAKPLIERLIKLLNSFNATDITNDKAISRALQNSYDLYYEWNIIKHLSKRFKPFDHLYKSSFGKFLAFLKSDQIQNLNIADNIFLKSKLVISFASNIYDKQYLDKLLYHMQNEITDKNHVEFTDKIDCVDTLLYNHCNVFLLNQKLAYNGENLLKTYIIEKDYLHNNLRNTGSSYAYGARLLVNGCLILYSFGENDIANSTTVFSNCHTYLDNIQITDEYKIGAINKNFMPIHNRLAFNNAVKNYFCNIDEQKILDQIIEIPLTRKNIAQFD